jgi:signal peptidase I
MKGFFASVWEISKTILICLAIIIPVRYLIIQPFYVRGASMEPNFHEKDYLLVDEISYRLHDPVRGDVIVFRYPDDPQEYFIKRVIGLPGEIITIKDGNVYITQPSGEMFQVVEPYLAPNTDTVSQVNDSVTLSDGQFFVFGDNRNGSKDSRSFGPVNKNFIIGRVFFRGLPLKRIGGITTPTYSN